jgi:C-terminal processing protease CtpA/Prc
MSKRTIFCLLLLCCTQPVFAQQSPTASPKPTPTAALTPATDKPLRDLVDQLDQAGLQRVIEQLRSSYVDSSALTNQEINQAAVEGLLSRLGPGAGLETKPQAKQLAPNRPFKSEIIQMQFGYLRLGTFSENELPRLDESLNNFRNRGVTGLILDLRTMQPESNFQLAADILSRFVAKGKVLFKLVEPKGGAEQVYTSSTEPIFTGPIAVLVGPGNAGTAEAVAGTLRAQLHSLVIGQKTSGRAVEYEHFTIGDNLILTVAIKELVIPDAPPIFPDGLTPDIAVSFPKQQQDAVLGLADQNGVADYIFDEERPHTNEAALVAGKNPDLDAYEADHASGKSKRQHIKDVILQRAIDFLTTISVFRVK